MKLQAMIDQDYHLSSWRIKVFRDERRVALKLSKKTSRGERFYVAHSPYTGARLTDVEFTAPVLLVGVRNNGGQK